jgi:hypothetical protein
MSERSGPFWDVVEGRASLPPAAATLGLEFIDADGDAGTVEVAFEGTEDFTNPAGNVLGGFQAAMLWETVGAALLAHARTRPVPVDDPDDGQLHAARPSRADRREGSRRAPRGRSRVPRGIADRRRPPGDRDCHGDGSRHWPRPGSCGGLTNRPTPAVRHCCTHQQKGEPTWEGL